MEGINHDSVAEIRKLLSTHQLTLKKRWGQNFLIRRDLRRRMVSLLLESHSPDDQPDVWEIGPGLGAMTDLLLEAGCRPLVFEIDHGLMRILRSRYGDSVTIVEGDFLKTWRGAVSGFGAPERVLGNLPYSSGSRMVAQLSETGPLIPRMVFLIQAELANRFGASPGTKDYSALSTIIQFRYVVESAFQVPASAFHPVPEVASTVVVLRPREPVPSPEIVRLAATIARAGFSQRRKKIGRLLKGPIAAGPDRTIAPEALAAALDSAGISKDNRPEDIRPEGYIRIAESLSG